MTKNTDYQRIEKAITFLVAHFREQPSLDELACHAGLSPAHFQKIFKRWAGISPKKFLQFLTVEALKNEIGQTANLEEAAEQVGLSAQSRVYDLFVHIEAVTPHEFRTKGKGVVMQYGTASTPFGECFIAGTGRGVCTFQFIDDDPEQWLAGLKKEWENAAFIENPSYAARIAGIVFRGDNQRGNPLRLLLKGTPFQINVWKALLDIPFGRVTSYQGLAKHVADTKATRAVASAVAKNPVGYIIPCHRVIRAEGIVGQYRWKPERKASIIGWEKSQCESPFPENKKETVSK